MARIAQAARQVTLTTRRPDRMRFVFDVFTVVGPTVTLFLGPRGRPCI
ncbi:hypothetical protein [Nocardia sp. BMG51109]|nr:hypothetical protein [Nocardia sp. BMG51109]